LGMDVLSIGVALAPMAADLDASLTTLQWFMSGYGIGVATFLITAGRLSDLFGARNMNRLGLLVFGGASILMAMAPNSMTAIVARLLQGVGGALMLSSSIGIAGHCFTGHDRAKVFSLIMAMAGLGMSLGPLIGGIAIHFFDWRAVFWVNVPIILFWGINNTVFLPHDPKRERQPFDFVGLVLLVATILLFVVPLSQGVSWGWGSALTLGLFAGFLFCAPLLILRERRFGNPLLDFSLLRIPGFLPASLCAFVAYFVSIGWLFLFSLYLHHVRGFSALETGLSFLPFSLGYFGVGLFSTRLAERIGWRRFLAAGSLLLAMGVGALSLIDPLTPYWVMGCGFAVVGIGYISANNAGITLAQGEAPADKAGAASGFSMMFRWLGSALGITVMTVVLHTASRESLAQQIEGREHLTVSAPVLMETLTEDGSWEVQIQRFPARERDEIRSLLASAYTDGVDRGLLLLGLCGLASLAVVPLIPKR